MRSAVLVGVALVVIAGFLWWRARAPLMPESQFRVSFDAETITATAPNGEARSVMWKDLTRVGIRTTDDGPAAPDVFWGLHTGADTAAIVFPGGSTGEQEILAAMQSRLPGFDDEQVVEAMGSTSNAYFVLWEKREVLPNNQLQSIALTNGAPAER